MPATTKSLVAAAPVTGKPPTVAVGALEVLVTVATGAAAGTSSVTLKTQSSPGARHAEPPDRIFYNDHRSIHDYPKIERPQTHQIS